MVLSLTSLPLDVLSTARGLATRADVGLFLTAVRTGVQTKTLPEAQSIYQAVAESPRFQVLGSVGRYLLFDKMSRVLSPPPRYQVMMPLGAMIVMGAGYGIPKILEILTPGADLGLAFDAGFEVMFPLTDGMSYGILAGGGAVLGGAVTTVWRVLARFVRLPKIVGQLKRCSGGP